MPVAGPVWTAEEDEMLRRLVAQHGTKKWAHLATIIKSKKSKQCRRRWKNFQDAELKKTGVWTPAEDALLREGHSKYGNKWTEIAKMVGGRTDNAVKNRWASLTKKNPRLANGSPSSVFSASADSSFSGSMPSQSRSTQSNSVSMQPTRLPGTRPSRLRSLTRADDAQPNQMSTSNSGTKRYQGSTESGPTVMTHPHLKGLTVRTHAKSEHGSDGSGSGRTPGSVNIRVWKDSLTPKERQQAQEVNALGLPVTIHLEDQMIPLPQAYAAAGNNEAKDQMVEANGLWRTDTDGDIAKWLNNGFTPRAGESGDLQPQAFAANTPRTQSLINNQQRQLLHKLFSKGSLQSQQQMLSDPAQQNMYYQQQQQLPQSGYGAQLQHSQQYMPQQQLQQQHMHVGAGGQTMAGPFKAGRSDQQAQQQQQLQQPTYHITAQAYDSGNYAQQQFGGVQIHPLAQHQGVLTRGQSFALNGQLGVMTRGQSFNNGQQGVLTRGQSFANGQSSGEQAMEGMIESPHLEVLVTPNFSSQELNMLLEALGNEEMTDMSAPLQHSSSLGVFM